MIIKEVPDSKDPLESFRRIDVESTAIGGFGYLRPLYTQCEKVMGLFFHNQIST